MTRSAPTKTQEIAPTTERRPAEDRTDGVRLDEASLDQATGGTFYGSGVYKTTDGGRG